MSMSFPVGAVVKNWPASAGDIKRDIKRHKERRKWQPTPVFLPGESHGQRSLVGFSPQGHKKSDMTEHTHRP